jgi:aminoglycoside phosphotransferase (APT) family kinase protein
VHLTELTNALRRMGLAGDQERPEFVPLTGGVSSDIWRVELERGPICIKRALSKLKVAAEWRVPVDRNASEVAWIELANKIVPSSAPRILGHDEGEGLFAMEFCDPKRYPLWKSELRDGRVDLHAAQLVGKRLGKIHAATAGDLKVARRFANDSNFYDIRLEPYLIAASRAHPDRADALATLATVTAETKKVLVHGDVSPKNILLGPDGPVFLDAECAWYGDPAFDLAFCLNHLLLKCLWTPPSANDFLIAFETLSDAYLSAVNWEDRNVLERRTARLLPGLFLARVDGKSPVEYLTDEGQIEKVRRVARALLAKPVARLADIRNAWLKELEQ